MSTRRDRAAFDDTIYRYVGSSPICEECRNRIGFAFLSCAAFPDRIPEEIWNGERDHNSPYPGDDGIRFEPMTDADLERKQNLAAEASERLRLHSERIRAQREAVGVTER